MLDNIKSPIEQQIINVSGYNVESNAKVKLILNGKEIQEVQADSEGKFIFSNVSLNEGENKIKASILSKEGKLKTSSEKKVVYQKPKPKESPSAKPSTTSIQTQSPSPKAKTEKTIMDKVWEALDTSIKTRDKYDIKYIEEDKLVRVTKEPYDAWDETAFVKETYRDFVKYGLVAFRIDDVDSIEFLYWANITDQYGKTNKEKGVDIAMKKSEFQKYDWKNLVGQNIYNQMLTSCYEHYINPAVMKNVKTDKLTLLSI